MKKIQTEIIKIRKEEDYEKLEKGAKIIRSGGLVAFPTETVYGLGANGLDEKAVGKIFLAKARPQDNPLILHVSHIDQVLPLVETIPETARKLMDRFWPGPLTIILKRSQLVPDVITGGLDTVAVRMPDNPIALSLIDLSQRPLAAPSANISGRPSPTRAVHVVEDLDGRVDLIVDGGTTGIGLESTVLDMSKDQGIILRPGGLGLEELRELLPNIKEDKNIVGEKDPPLSPGQKYKHYAPRAEVLVFSGRMEDMVREINKYAQSYGDQGKKVGIMATEETKAHYKKGLVISVGSREEQATIAHRLFNSLREFDRQGVDIILAEAVEPVGIGRAIMNRLGKAAADRIIEV